MPSLNKVILMGNLTKDPELKYLQSGTTVAKAGIAMNRSYTDSDGNKQDNVDFIDIEAFGKTADIMSDYLKKGDPVIIEGRIRQQRWQTDNGQNRSKHDVVVERFTFVPKRENGDGDAGLDAGSDDEEVPF